MIHLVALVGIAILLFRVLWLIFNALESLIPRNTLSTPPNAQTGPKKITNNIPTVTQPINSKDNRSIVSVQSKEGSEQFPKGSAKITSKAESENAKASNLDASATKTNLKLQREEKEASRWSQREAPVEAAPKEESKGEEVVYSESKITIDEKKWYQEKISKLMEEIEKYRHEKVNYIQRIEEIIQHVSNQQELSEEIRSSSQDGESQVINNLKHELNVATQKMSEQKKNLILEFESKKEELIRTYEERIDDCQRHNRDKIQEYSKIIDEITQRIYQLEEEKSHNYDAGQKQDVDHSSRLEVERNRLTLELQAEKEQCESLRKKKQQLQELANNLQQRVEETCKELQNLKKQISLKQNDQLEARIKFETQIESLLLKNKEINDQLQVVREEKFELEQHLEKKTARDEQDKLEAEQNIVSDMISDLEKQLLNEKLLREEESRKYNDTVEELKFCQEQLRNARDTQSQLREKLSEAITASKKTTIKKEDVQHHPEYLAIKKRLEELEARRAPQQEFKSSIIHTYNTPREARQLSPTFPNVPNQSNIRTVSPHSESRGAYKSGFMAAFNQAKDTHLEVPPTASTILDRRYKTPSEKPVPQSSINEGGILGNVYLGETNILDEGQRNLIIHEISALKKITIRKTALLYSSAQKVNKAVTEYLVGVPNLLVIVELANNSIIGAFTQNAFSKANHLSHSTIMSKAMIFSLVPQIFLVNENRGDAIHFEENILTWGKEEIVINCKEPLSITSNLDCEGAIYPSGGIKISEFLGSEERTIPITKIEAYRTFFG